MNNCDYAIAYEGHKLSRSKAEALEQTLEHAPDESASRLKLIGYYSHHYYCCEQASKQRLRHVKWLFEKAPEFDSSLTPLMYVHLQDREGYNRLKKILESTLGNYGTNPLVCANVAALARAHEPEWALRLLEKSVQLDTTNMSMKKRLDDHRKMLPVLLANREASLHLSEPFVYPENCSHH